MSQIDQIIADAVARKDLPFAVAMVANSRDVLWEGRVGKINATRPAGPDTSFRLFSMTKAIGSLAALIMIERGKIALETPVVEVVPEFGALQVLESMGPDGPVFRPPRRQATLRHLLTHTSGLMYGEYEPSKLLEWQESIKAPHILAGTLDSMNYYPLMFDPGDDWAYGVGLDWVGRIIQILDGRSIDRFVTEEILEPLGMRHTFFEADQCGDSLADLVLREPDGTIGQTELPLPSHPEIYGMGQSLLSSAPDYIRFLRMVLNHGELEGTRVVSRAGIEPMFVNQIGDLSVKVLKSLRPAVAVDAEFFAGYRKTHTIGFVRLEEAVPGMRGAGSLTWAGLCNTHFWVDPEKDLAVVLMTQSLPFCEQPFMATYAAFEREVYRKFST